MGPATTNGLESDKKTHQVAGVGEGFMPCLSIRRLTCDTRKDRFNQTRICH
jgi:hypothetical protein